MPKLKFYELGDAKCINVVIQLAGRKRGNINNAVNLFLGFISMRDESGRMYIEQARLDYLNGNLASLARKELKKRYMPPPVRKAYEQGNTLALSEYGREGQRVLQERRRKRRASFGMPTEQLVLFIEDA
jgi:hypothetical protein